MRIDLMMTVRAMLRLTARKVNISGSAIFLFRYIAGVDHFATGSIPKRESNRTDPRLELVLYFSVTGSKGGMTAL